jgi:phosphotransferase system  glucose/maltose/N-acetylglucosamine-specific IIC component
MSNRTAAVIITIVAILFCGCPGLAFLCFGVTNFIDYYGLNSYIYGFTDKTASDIWGAAGICGGIIFLVIAVVVSVLVLRRKRETPPSPQEPLPPAV